jgi:hydroxymethylpyrimidine/phosphomethylpyrimidine kinase
MDRPFTALTIAGSDPSGGAGLQADLKTFHAHGVYGMAVVSALTVQSARGVEQVQPVAPEWVADQLAAVLEHHPVDAIKIGMLGDASVVRAVADVLENQAHLPPIVLDPVLRASAGSPDLLASEAYECLVTKLLPLCVLVTPNLDELEALLGDETTCAFAERTAVTALVTGGHGQGEAVEDVAFFPDGRVLTVTHPRIAGPGRHGTGCTLSSAIAARLARGDALALAIEGATHYVHTEIAKAAPGGFGPTPPLLHDRSED